MSKYIKLSAPVLLIGTLVFCSGFIINTYASTSSELCFEQAKLPLEKAFCEVKAVSSNPALPSLAEFKRNTPKIQQLLLKRDAERYGIVLPSAPPPTKSAARSASLKTDRKPSKDIVQASLAECDLHEQFITCSTERYSLLNNLKNNQLKAEVFSSHNQLILPRKKDTQFSNESDYRYLSHIYPIYINKMIDLGLGDSTMSFTKFATVYWQGKIEGLDFVDRFQFMYSQLKQERGRNQINTRYRDNYPNEIHQCMRLDETLIVCDNMNQNWIYKLR